MAEPPGHCRTIALQRQHVGKAPGIKAGTSELPVLDARLWAWPDPVPSPTPCTWPPPGTGTKPFGLSRCRSCAKKPSIKGHCGGRCQEVSPACKSLQSK